MGAVRTAVECIPGVRVVEALVGGPKRIGVAVGVGAVALGGVVGLGGLESSTNVEAGHGQVTNVYAMHKTCNAGYDAKMADVKADYSVKVKIAGLALPTGYSETVTYDGTITNEVCHGAEVVHYYYPDDAEYKSRKACAGEKVCAVLKGKYKLTTYEKNPGKGYNVTGNGLTRAMAKNFINDAHAIPGVHWKADGPSNTLRGLAFLSAQETSSTSCLKAALPVVRKVEQSSLGKDITNQINGAAGFYNAKPQLNPDGSDVAVVDEAKVKGVTTQYSALIERLKSSDNHLTMESGSIGKCSMSPELKKKAAHLDNQGQEARQ